MPRPRDAKIWNEELNQALQAREDVARRQGKRTALLYSEGRRAIEAVRQDIYTFSNGRIVNLPSTKLKKTVDNLCRAIIDGTEPVLPPGYIAHEPAPGMQNAQTQQQRMLIQGNPYQNDPYLNSIKKRGGAFAILMAFYVSPANQVLTKQQICDTGQAFCDTEMLENYFAGRSRGAWASIKTLNSHDLVVAANNTPVVGYSARAGGLRTLGGPSTYMLTDNGKLFTRALLEKNPDVQQQIRALRGNHNYHNNTTGIDAHDDGHQHHHHQQQVYQPYGNSNDGSNYNSDDRTTARPTVSVARGSPVTAAATTTATTANSIKDERELREWLQSALPGHQKEFNVGKSRRTRLHDLCNALNSSSRLLRDSGLQLQHESHDNGMATSRPSSSAARKLFVTLRSSHNNNRAQVPGYYQNNNGDEKPGAATTAVASWQGPLPIKSSPPRARSSSNSSSRALFDDDDDECPVHKRRLMMMVPAKIAAANAAFERQAFHESLSLAAATTTTTPKKSAQRQLPQQPFKVTPPPPPHHLPLPTMIDLLDENDSDDDRKMPANPYKKPVAAKTTKLPAVILELDSDSDDDILLTSVFNKKPSAAAKRIHGSSSVAHDDGALSFKASHRVDDPVDLTESQESHEGGFALVEPDSKPASSLSLKATGNNRLVVYIDDRERNRNHTPRTLRLELTRLLSTGLLSMVWPKGLPNASVEEHRLDSGDFTFSVLPPASANNNDNSREVPLPIAVERKRIGDLVQRSYQKDHWYQLQRMQDEAARCHGGSGGGVCVLLLEGDSRTTVQYTPYGAQEVEASSPFDHTIDDEDSLYRFMGRVILNDRAHSTRFIQAKDEQGSLRAVGALGLMSVTSEQRQSKDDDRGQRIDSKAERICLKNRLQNGGIPWELVLRIVDEIRSVKQMDRLYASVADEGCRDRLLVPLIADLCCEIKLAGTASGWSAAVHRVWFSTLSDPGLARERFDQLCHLVEDHALLLHKLHAGFSPDAALDALLSSQQLLEDELERIVSIELPSDHKDCFLSDSEGGRTFFSVNLQDKPQKIPSIAMRTTAGPYYSARLLVFLLDGEDFVRRLLNAFSDAEESVTVARKVARKLKQDFCAVSSSASGDATVLLIRGLNCALDNAAKRNGFRSETRVLAEMVQAELMIGHETVVLHAVRLNGDREKIIQQLSLSCFHFQLLTHKRGE